MALGCLLLLVGLVFALGSNPPSDVLKPGALVAPVGEVWLVEDAVTVRYDLQDLLHVGVQLGPVYANVRRLHTMLSDLDTNVHDDNLKGVLQLQSKRLHKLRRKIVKLSNALPTGNVDISQVIRARPKRGLFNFVGIASKYLFGTATSGDVKELGKKLHELALASKINGRLISQSYEAITFITSSVQEVINKTNNLINVVNKFSETFPYVTELFLISECLLESESIMDDIADQVQVIIKDLVNAALGRVDSDLLPLPHLEDALAMATRDHHLSPIFDMGEIEFYYPLIHSFLTHVSIVVTIPMRSRDHFSLWQVVPFPFVSQGNILQLSTAQAAELVMLSEDSTYLASTSYDTLSHCKASFYNFFVCPAYPFVFQPVTDVECTHSLIRSNDDNILQWCKFEPVILRSVYHVHLLTTQYFYFPNATEVSLSCKARPSYVKVAGYYSVADHCEVRTSDLVTFPNRQHLTFATNLSSVMNPITRAFNLSSVNVTVVSEKLQLITYLNDSDVSNILYRPLPFYLEPTVIVPTVMSPFVLVVLLGCVCYCICRFRARYAFPLTLPASRDCTAKASQTV